MKRALGRPAVRTVAALAATAMILVPLGVMWVNSLVPSTYSVMDMGYPDYGGGPQTGMEHGSHGGGHGTGAAAGAGHGGAHVSVAELRGPASGAADVRATLVARQEKIRLKRGLQVAGYTLNRTSPGPVLRAMQGDLVEVTLVNRNVSDGVTLHWHGVDVPNGEDGVAGVTQDAVAVGGKHIYRFVAEDAGTYWYHSHQVSHKQVRGGLFGTFVIEPRQPASPALREVLAVAHTYDSIPTINGGSGRQHVSAPAGTRLRVRVVNTDNGPLPVWVSRSSYSVLAIDGFDLNKPTPVRDRTLLLGAGGRADLSLTTPMDGSAVRIDLGGGATYLTVGATRAPVSGMARPERDVDLLTYGSPKKLDFDPRQADREFDYRIGHRPGFVDGKPGLWWSINGHLFPDVPMFVVAEGDVVRMTLSNSSGKVHPMHLHGHHALVLSRNGVRATGSPWWVDSLNVADDETYEIAFRADNPGIWMDHCHDLTHAAEGLVAHLAYVGVSQPFRVGGPSHNRPE